MTWSAEARDVDLIGQVDVLLTKLPPFGTKIKIEDPSILEQYDLAHAWDYDSGVDRYELREPRTLTKSQPPEILFIERCVQFLKPGTGVMAIVLPDAILGAPGLGHVREWIFRKMTVLASIDMHPDTFQPHNSTQTSLLVLRRKTAAQIELDESAGVRQDYPVFLAMGDHIGHDKRGNPTYVRDEEGNEIAVSRTEEDIEVRDGVAVPRVVETRLKLVDDNTTEISQLFREWVAVRHDPGCTGGKRPVRQPDGLGPLVRSAATGQ